MMDRAQEEEELYKLITMIEFINVGFSSVCWQLYNEVPLVRSLPLPHQTILRTAEKIYVFIQKEVEEHKATLTPGEPRDFTDAYLEEIQKPEKKSSGFEEEQLRVLLSDLFLAGTETTAAALQWTMLYLVAFPEIQ
ncbi:PREDICTED: cytochrome P450 2J5-like, partial [Thamnophis sirtalis]|uniref:Cytochrome P450 2J5-like n=1 Tax=Thamnophis sirtalis TaxID=35019 RepID=A0A6I9XJZ2_9SAUR